MKFHDTQTTLLGGVRCHRGFTLVELAIVVVIISILAAGALAKFNVSAHRSHEKEADLALSQIYRLQEVHRNEYGEHATSEEELSRVGYVRPTLNNFTWGNTVDIPQCLVATGPWNSRRITADGDLENC